MRALDNPVMSSEAPQILLALDSGGQSVCEGDDMHPEPFFLYLTQINPGIVILK